MNKLFLIMGPESSGNHLTSLILKTMNCYWEEPQKLDDFLKGKCKLADITNNSNVVLRRSIPYGRDWVDPVLINSLFSKQGYKTYTIILQREWIATMLSNYYHRSSTVEEAWETLVKAEKHISKYLNVGSLDPFYILNVSSLMKDPEPSIKGLELFTGLKWPKNLAYEKIVKDSDMGRHQLFIDHGFNSVNRKISHKYMGRVKPKVKR